MIKVKTMLVALVAVFAFGAVAVSSASAAWTASPWLVRESGTWKEVTRTVNVMSTGAVKLKNGEQEFECEGTNEGTIGVGGLDLISSITPLGACKILKAGACETSQPAGLPEAKPKNLPWHTLLLDELGSNSIRDLILPDNTLGLLPGWGVKCQVFLIGPEEDECVAADESTAITNGEKDFKATFSGEVNPISICKGIGTAEHGSVGGSILFLPTTGEEAKGVEGVLAN